MEYQWNDTDWGTQQYAYKNLSYCHFVRNKSHVDLPGNELRPLQWLTTWAMVWLRWLAFDWVTWYLSHFLSPTSSVDARTFRKWTILQYNSGGTVWMGHESPYRFCGFCDGPFGTGAVFLPVLQFSPVSIIPPLLHTHSSIYHPRCIMFFSQYFSFSLSVSFHHCSILIYPSTTHAV